MNRGELRRRLALEARQYLADVHDLLENLKRTEGWVTLVLIAVIIVLVVAWFLLGLGFDRLLSVATAWGVWRPTACRDISDAKGLFIVLDGVAFFMVSILALGEMMLLIDRRRRNLPPKPSAVLIPTVAMLIIGLAGIITMRIWC